MLFIWLTLAFLIFKCAAIPKFELLNQGCHRNSAEVLFLLDSSSSIWPVDFKKQLKFVSDIIEDFEVGPHKTRVGVASFSYRYHENIALDRYEDKAILQAAVKNIPQYYGGTYTNDALDGVRTSGLGTSKVRPGIARIAIVITDGESYNEKKTKEAAKKLKDDGVIVFAIGIGSQINKEELVAIASEPKDKFFFEVGNYGLLETIKKNLTAEACNITIEEQGKEPTCGTKNSADIMFLVDPGEVGVTHTTEIFEYIGMLTDEFSTANDNIHVGLDSRNCDNKNINLGEYTDKTELSKAFRNTKVSGLPHMIKRLRTHAYRPENGGRDSVRHMAVIFVDDTLSDAKTILDEARRTKNYDVELFVVAIGDTAVDDQIMTLCSSPVDRHLIRVPSYSDLKNSKAQFLEKFCHGL